MRCDDSGIASGCYRKPSYTSLSPFPVPVRMAVSVAHEKSPEVSRKQAASFLALSRVRERRRVHFSLGDRGWVRPHSSSSDRATLASPFCLESENTNKNRSTPTKTHHVWAVGTQKVLWHFILADEFNKCMNSLNCMAYLTQYNANAKPFRASS